MLKKFILESALVQAFTRPPLSGPEVLARSPLARATTPDQIIVAHILHEYAKNPSAWRLLGDLPAQHDEEKTRTVRQEIENYRHGDRTTWYRSSKAPFRLSNDTTTVCVTSYVKNKDGDGISPWFVKYFVEVNSVQLSADASNHLLTTLKTLIEKAKEAERVATEARKAMEENERKWNLAEKLLGMKRNEHGALEPINVQPDPQADPVPASHPRRDRQ